MCFTNQAKVITTYEEDPIGEKLSPLEKLFLKMRTFMLHFKFIFMYV